MSLKMNFFGVLIKMFSLSSKEKFLLFFILCVPFLVISILQSDFIGLIHDNHWFFNEDFFRIWFYIIFLSFVFIPFSEIVLFKKGTFFQRILLITAFIFLGVNVYYYTWEVVYLSEIFATFIFIILLSFSSIFTNSPKINLKECLINISLVVLSLGLTWYFYIKYYTFLNFVDILSTGFYIIIIFLIIYHLFSSENTIFRRDT